MKHLERALDGQNQTRKYISLFLIVFFGGQLIGSIPLLTVLFAKMFSSGNLENINPENLMDYSANGLSSNLMLALIMLSFVVMFFLFVLLIKPFHKRTVKETVNGRSYLRKGRIGMGMLVWGVMLLISLAINLSFAEEGVVELQFNIERFLPLLVIVLVLLPFQTTIEEILFRGYLTQGIAARTGSRWAALIAVSLLFGLMHIFNPEVKEFGFWLSMPQYILMGLFLGLISILDDGIEIAIGVHYTNNAFAALFATYDSSVFQTDAVFRFNTIDPKYELLFLAAAAFLSVYILAKIYKWNFGILNRKVEISTPPPPLPPDVGESAGRQSPSF